MLPPNAHASLLSPELEDKLATGIAILVLFLVPVVLIVVFWLVHILPEKIAHQRHHPQFEAIRTLCLLSLVFGGLLWPIAWIWAYSKPVHVQDGVRHGQGRSRAVRSALMEVLLLGIYSFFVWLIFIKLKLLPWTTPWKVAVVIFPVVCIAIMLLLLNIVAPTTTDVRVVKYIVPVVSQVRGRVIEVPVENNRPVKKGDVLFKIDPTPYQNDVHSLEARLAG